MYGKFIFLLQRNTLSCFGEKNPFLSNLRMHSINDLIFLEGFQSDLYWRHLIKKGGTTRFQASCDKGEAYLDSFLPYWASLTKRATLKSLVIQAPVWLVLKTVDINQSKTLAGNRIEHVCPLGMCNSTGSPIFTDFQTDLTRAFFFQPLVKRN